MSEVTPKFPYRFESPWFRRAGYAAWLLLTVYAVIFYQERATFMDGGFQLFELINSEDFGIYHYRLSNPVTQIFAWLAVKAGLPLKAVMLLYSLNFVVFFAFIYHLLVRWCKNDYLALTQVGFFTLLTSESFYFLTPEFYQGMSLLLLLFGLLLRYDLRKHKLLLPGLLLLLVPIIFDHLLLSAFFLFLWSFFWLDRADFRRRWEYYVLLVGMFGVYYLSDEVFISWYDAMKKDNFHHQFATWKTQLWAIPAHSIFLEKCKTIYKFFPALLLVVTYGYFAQLYKKEGRGDLVFPGKLHVITPFLNRIYPLLKWSLAVGFCFAYLLINHISDPTTDYLYYSEVNYIGLTVPLLVALFFDLAPRFSKQKLLLYFVVIALLHAGLQIGLRSRKFIRRHAKIIETLEKSPSDRVIVRGANDPKSYYIQNWSMPYESLLITAAVHPDSAQTLLIADNAEQYRDFLDREDLFLEVMRQSPIENLHKRYFRLGEGRYEVR